MCYKFNLKLEIILPCEHGIIGQTIIMPKLIAEILAV
jgi:hypothetical protein